MTLDGVYTGTVDRIEAGQAVLLVEAEGETVAERLVPADELPEGVTEGTVCECTFDDGELAAIEPLPESTEERKARLRERFDRLSERLDDDT
ncbi:MAG: hypothetical protein ACI8UR_001477 [Natronomonas sp.]|jgi:hypothetical protein|uniref:DUF3006 domain-containing protein n=1 Tax=Natronomonas sp. TaxID=2184060 RepID=UPI0039891CBF